MKRPEPVARLAQERMGEILRMEPDTIYRTARLTLCEHFDQASEDWSGMMASSLETVVRSHVADMNLTWLLPAEIEGHVQRLKREIETAWRSLARGSIRHDTVLSRDDLITALGMIESNWQAELARRQREIERHEHEARSGRRAGIWNARVNSPRP